ncbi:enoyl-CoA hydratase/isomerase family protein [Streptomyces sp. NPDC096311]|uniref:enoyl-CoA hydratase/isomerase family protein n=1 Tax=Streptomyces sp. NPDC096311 TaxID=3366083 RepID=UPI00381939AC
MGNAPSSEDELLVERDGHVVVLTINRPERLNAFSRSVRGKLTELWPQLDADPEVRAVVVTAAGDRAFSSGGDVSELDGPEDYPRYTARQAGVFTPTITAVNGMCASAGLHFVADADIVICSENATFFDTHVHVGQVSALEPIGLARRVPLGEVLRMVALGKAYRIDARRALELGLVSEVVPGEKLRERAVELGHIIASASPAAVRASLRAVWESLDRGLDDGLKHGYQILQDHLDHPDAAEGPAAFMAKRSPNWSVRGGR